MTSRRRVRPRPRTPRPTRGWPNYQRILDIGDAQTPADAAIVGNEASVTAQLQACWTRAPPTSGRRCFRSATIVQARCAVRGSCCSTSWTRKTTTFRFKRRARRVHGIPRRVGAETSKTRDHLLDCVERLMFEGRLRGGDVSSGRRRSGRHLGTRPVLLPRPRRSLRRRDAASIRSRTSSGSRAALRDAPRAAPPRAVGVQPGRIDRCAHHRVPRARQPPQVDQGPRSQRSPSRSGGCS